MCLTLLIPSAAAARSVKISGHRLVGTNGHTLRLIGVNRSGSEYACAGPDGGGGFGYAIFQGPTDAASVTAMRSWHINAVALPLNEACWLGGYAGLKPDFTGANYRNAIAAYVKRLSRAGIYVVLRLSGAAPGDNAYGSDTTSSTEVPMASADHSVDFWSSVAAKFKRSSRVLFHTFDEPHDVDWACLRDGCTAVDAPDGQQRYGTYQTAGNQEMVDAIREAGARQPIIISGPDFAADLSGWRHYMPHDPRHQLMADVSSFDYSDYVVSHASTLRSFARRYPVIVGGFGDTHCVSTYSVQVMNVMDSIHQSYLAWTWNTVQDYGGCDNALLDDPAPEVNGFPSGYYSGRPSGFGAGVRDHFRSVR